MKICTKCKINKELSEFYKDNTNKSNGRLAQCKECIRAYMRKHSKTSKRMEYNREYKKRLSSKEYHRSYKRSTIGRNYNFKYKYNITIEQYEIMLQKQNGVCAICHKPETMIDKRHNIVRALAVDHCHKTGKIRGLLCGNHNRVLGLIEDDIQILQNAIQYLKGET